MKINPVPIIAQGGSVPGQMKNRLSRLIIPDVLNVVPAPGAVLMITSIGSFRPVVTGSIMKYDKYGGKAMVFIKDFITFISHHVYSIHFILILVFSGFISLFFNTDQAYFYGNYKDFVISFFAGIANIVLALILINIKIIHTKFF